MKFYKIYLDEGKRKKFAEAATLSKIIGEDIECTTCNSKWVKSIIERPIKIILTRNYLPDYTAILPEQKIVSERMKEIIEQYSLAKCTFDKIITKTVDQLTDQQIVDFKMEGENISKFCTIPSSYFTINLNAGISIHSDMNVLLHKCEECGRRNFTKLKEEKSMLLNYILDYSTWNGQDLFTETHFTNLFICTERFVEICKLEKITGLGFDEIKVI